MSAKSGLIRALVSSVIITASISSVRDENIYFKECQEKYSLKNENCTPTRLDETIKTCIHGENVHFYCVSPSPIKVVIGRLPEGSHLDTSFPETLNITSTSTPPFENGRNTYCIEITGKISADYFLKCRQYATDTDKWAPFNKLNDRRLEGRSFNPHPQALQYVAVNKTNPIAFCDSVGPVLFKQVPVLLPCGTWQMCTAVLTNHYGNAVISLRNVGLVDLATIVNITSRCSSVWNLIATLHRLRAQNFSKPGLLAFHHHHQNSEYLLPYNPPGNQDNLRVKAFVAFIMESFRVEETTRIVCQSSVLHSCGFDIVTKNLQITRSHGDCHRHSVTVEPIQGLNGWITCRAFDEFRGTWVSKTEYFDKNSSKSPNVYETTKNPSLAGNNNTNVSDGSATTGTLSYARTADKNISNEKKTSEIPSQAGNENTTNLPPVQDSADSGSISLILIIVGAVLGGIFICFLILLPWLIYLYKTIHLQRRRIELSEEEICEFMEGMQMEKGKSKGIHNVFVLPYDRNLEVSKIAVDFKTTILGSGAFGKVLKGIYQGRDVAIKTIDGTTLNVDAFRSLLSELKIMSYLGKHEHVMELVGAITSNIKTGEVYLILEYCAHGSAISHIREHREDFVSFLSDDKTAYVPTTCAAVNDSGSELSSHHLVRWSYEVACGMEYVSYRNIYHGDLAARNILLTENLTVKVGDFGLSRQLDVEKYACYVQKKDCPLPLKWMAIESLRDLKFSIQSDVWSFGVTLWEFFSLGTMPYPGMEWNRESWKSLCEGVRLDRPEFASLSIYNNVMRICWNENPKDRPTFSALKTLLQDELEAFSTMEFYVL